MPPLTMQSGVPEQLGLGQRPQYPNTQMPGTPPGPTLPWRALTAEPAGAVMVWECGPIMKCPGGCGGADRVDHYPPVDLSVMRSEWSGYSTTAGCAYSAGLRAAPVGRRPAMGNGDGPRSPAYAGVTATVILIQVAD